MSTLNVPLNVPVSKPVKEFYRNEGAKMEVSMSSVAREVLRQHAINALEARGDKEAAEKLRRGGKKK